MVVHPGAGNSTGTLVNALLAHCTDLSGIGGELRPGIVHRLDKGTSGVLVAAKNDHAHQVLSTQFSVHSVKRIYQALIYGNPPEDTGKIEGIIGRHPTERLRLSGKAKNGKHAVTRWRVKERYGRITLVELRLETGRTHQIRVHLTEAGFPLLGDPLYPDGGRINNLPDTQLRGMINKLGRQALHAHTLGFIHPTTSEYLEFTSEMPEDMATLVAYLRGGAGGLRGLGALEDGDGRVVAG
jgi:23S rRNA pseudouridine1911/1915/1917 synthase